MKKNVTGIIGKELAISSLVIKENENKLEFRKISDNSLVPIKAGTPSSSDEVATMNYVDTNIPLPTGSFIWYCGTTVPSLFLECNGAAINRTTYSNLFAVIGTTYGVGDGSTTFNLPNLVTAKRFIRAKGSGKAVGTAEVEAYLNHSHAGSSNSTGSHSHVNRTNSSSSVGAYSDVFCGTGRAASNYDSTVTSQADGAHSHTITVSASTTGSTETRPVNIAMFPCIKY